MLFRSDGEGEESGERGGQIARVGGAGGSGARHGEDGGNRRSDRRRWRGGARVWWRRRKRRTKPNLIPCKTIELGEPAQPSMGGLSHIYNGCVTSDTNTYTYTATRSSWRSVKSRRRRRRRSPPPKRPRRPPSSNTHTRGTATSTLRRSTSTPPATMVTSSTTPGRTPAGCRHSILIFVSALDVEFLSILCVIRSLVLMDCAKHACPGARWC